MGVGAWRSHTCRGWVDDAPLSVHTPESGKQGKVSRGGGRGWTGIPLAKRISTAADNDWLAGGEGAGRESRWIPAAAQCAIQTPNPEIGSTAEDQLSSNEYQDSPFGSPSYPDVCGVVCNLQIACRSNAAHLITCSDMLQKALAESNASPKRRLGSASLLFQSRQTSKPDSLAAKPEP